MRGSLAGSLNGTWDIQIEPPSSSCAYFRNDESLPVLEDWKWSSSLFDCQSAGGTTSFPIAAWAVFTTEQVEDADNDLQYPGIKFACGLFGGAAWFSAAVLIPGNCIDIFPATLNNQLRNCKESPAWEDWYDPIGGPVFGIGGSVEVSVP